jgi:DNA-binding MarR family transcriptional regulator
MPTPDDIPALVLRLARLAEADDWARRLNPAQAAALDFLARANRFSRSPSHLAEWLGTTRGTVSQTLKALAARGLVAEEQAPRDRRSISYALTEAGRAALGQDAALQRDIAALPQAQAIATADALATLLRARLARRNWRAFGLCRICRHHMPDPGGETGYCRLLQVALAAGEPAQICAEHAA